MKNQGSRLWCSSRRFLDNLSRLSAPNYLPTEQDLLRTRVKTTGITEVLFELKGLTFSRRMDQLTAQSELRYGFQSFT
uniref:Uncharacterized protein n=1 Tax=Parascaris equorum TaxID=6256 RepID=A0A914RLE5_PAREQ